MRVTYKTSHGKRVGVGRKSRVNEGVIVGIELLDSFKVSKSGYARRAKRREPLRLISLRR